MISLQNISKSYDSGNTRAVDDVTLDIAKGSVLVLLGESGCGKTTTLKMINRLIEPSSGTIRVADQDISSVDPVRLRRSIGYVIQEVGLFPHMSVAANISVVPELLGWEAEKISSRVDELLTMVGLPPGQYRQRQPSELSGGQRQRVGLARALAANPELMLMDEPFGALDPITREDVIGEFRKIQRNLNLTVVMVTHNMWEALTIADSIAVMKSGRVVAFGTPKELLDNAGDPYARELLETPRRQARELSKITERENR